MATYTVTTANWNSVAFWSGISETTGGHVLDLSGLDSSYSVDFDESAGSISLSDGTTTFTVGDASGGFGPFDATLPVTTFVEFFDTIIGTDGDDTIESGTGDESIQSGAGDDRIIDAAGADTIETGTGDDTVFVSSGSDDIDMGDGSDVAFVSDGDGADIIDGGSGGTDQDTLSLGFSTGATVTLSATGDGTYTDTGASATGSFFDIEAIDATEQADSIDASADSAGLIINADFGDDTVLGGTGGDTIVGGGGADSITLGGGADQIAGGDGIDTITGIDGDDFVNFGDGAETASATGGANTVMGGAGDDTLVSDDAADELHGGTGADSITGAGGADTIDGGSGADSISAGAGADLVVGGSGLDTITGGGGDDTIYGDDEDIGANAGTLSSFDFSTISSTGDAGTGVIGRFAVYDSIGTTDDGTVIQAVMTVVDADDPDIALSFGTNSVFINGDAGSDAGSGVTLSFEFFDQATGDPVQISGVFTFQDIDTTAESVTAQTADVQSVALSATPVTNLSASDSGEQLAAASDTTSSTNADENHWAQFTYANQQELVFEVTARGAGTNYAFSTDAFTDTPTTITATPESQDDDIDGGTGDDLIYGQTGSDTIDGEDGADTIHGGRDDDTLTGGADDDVFAFQDDFGNDTVTGGETTTTGTDFDSLDFSDLATGVTADFTAFEAGTVTDGADTVSFSEIERLVLTDEDDVVDASLDGSFAEMALEIDAGDGDDLITSLGTGSGGDGNADTVLAGAGSDTVSTGSNDDSIDGGAGDDSLNAGSGDDTVTGGGGDDTIVVEDFFGADTITGGETDETTGDLLDLGALTTDTTIDLSSSDPEAGTVSDGADTLSFAEIERIALGGGRDTIVLADGSGTDTVYDFDMADSGDGTTNDQLDVTGLTDSAGNPVSTEDVAVTDTVGDGSGDAILTFPDGSAITLVGVDPALVSTPAQLESIGIPAAISSDLIVSGTGGDDTINDAYLGDLDGDLIDNSDYPTDSDDDSVEAGAGDDSIDAGTGNDTILGEGGDDEIFLDVSLQDDSVIGGETDETLGDRINFSTIGDDITITFSGDETGTLTDGVNTTSFEEIERFQMGTGNDSVIGSDEAEHIIGNFGDDTIIAGGGDDTIFSGFDDDSVDGGAGADSLVGSTGADTIDGGAGDDAIDLGTGDGDVDLVILEDGDGEDVITGFEVPTDLGGGAFAGNDLLDVTGLNDLDGNPVNTGDVTVTDTVGDGSGDAILTFPNGEAITLVGVDPADVSDPAQLAAMGIPLFPGDFIVEGTGLGDLIDDAYIGDPEGDMVDNSDGVGGTQADRIEAGAGDDTVLAGDADDTIIGDLGDDSIDGGAGADSVLAGAGNDTVLGDAGDDSLDGGGDDDSVLGGSGSDTLTGGDGVDTLSGGTDADSIAGGADEDLIVIEDFFGADTITGGETTTTGSDEDTLDASAVTDDLTVIYSATEDGAITDGTTALGFAEIEALTLGSGADSVDGSGATGGLDIDGGAGSDTLTGGDGADTLDGGGDDDSLFGGDGADLLTGGLGDDSLRVGSGDTAEGGDGDDTFFVSAGDVDGTPLTVVGGETDETLGDTLNITGPATIAMADAESGTVTWLDGSVLTFSEIETINYTPCFTPGTMIKTAKGEVDVVDIQLGDVVLTRDNGYQQVRWVGNKPLTGLEISANAALRPIKIAKGALGHNSPERDMLVSPQHRVVMTGAAIELLFGEDEVLVAACHLVGRPGITEICPQDGVTYVHFMFDRHELVMSDGCWTESFQPGDLSLAGLDDAQRNELFALFPQLQSDYGRASYASARMSLKSYQARLLTEA